MAARPSRRPHRDQSPYITLKWHRLSHSGAQSQQNQGGGGVPWAPVTLSCSHVALASLQQENRATVWGAERSCCVEPNFKE